MINPVDTSSLINFFDRLYVINLPKRRDRRQAMEWELTRAGVSLPSNKVAIFPAIEPTDKGHFPSIGTRGCFLSHLAVLKEARRGLNNVLILEDDLSFTKKFLKCQNIVTDKLQHLEWDIVYLGHGEAVSSKESFCFQEYKQPIVTASFVAFNGRVIPRLVDFLEEVLKRPAGHPMGGPMHVDGAYSTFRQQNPEIVTLVAIPSLGFQRASPSNIAENRWFDKLSGLNQFTEEVRKVKNWYLREFK